MTPTVRRPTARPSYPGSTGRSVDETDRPSPRWAWMSDNHPSPASIVLVVEDDELVRFSAVLMLEDVGFTVIEATNADEAWEVLSCRRDMGVLFTDVDMPGSICGRRLAKRVFRSWPAIRLILTSGRRNLQVDEVPNHGLFVAKPYTGSQVVDAIRAAG